MEVLCKGCGAPIAEDDGAWRMIGADIVFCCAECDQLYARVAHAL